ncbi:hypothetical protein BC827DRAFT_1252065 [Russula dissimulans]|nr:hypothetical protein BC827DRAFT_1252065 [Russula dissimulans]
MNTSSASTSRAAAQPIPTTSPKRSRSAAGLDDDDDAPTNTSTLLPAVELRPRHKMNGSDVIDNEGAGPSRERHKRATATTALSHSDQVDAHFEPVQTKNNRGALRALRARPLPPLPQRRGRACACVARKGHKGQEEGQCAILKRADALQVKVEIEPLAL